MSGELLELKLMAKREKAKEEFELLRLNRQLNHSRPRGHRWWAFWQRPQRTAPSADNDTTTLGPVDRRRRQDLVDALHEWLSAGGSPAERSHLLTVLMDEYSDVPADARQVLVATALHEQQASTSIAGRE
jgi:hypothetical protein